MYAGNEQQFRGINRTICIGMGGTGRDVLMRIRRLIVDRYGRLNKLPVVSFVHVDTDTEATNMAGLRAGNIYRGVDLRFQEAEKVSATMTATEVSNLVSGLEQYRTDRTQISPYEHIAQWFPPQLLRNVQAIDQGARGIRPVGRLAFFHNYIKIKTAIESAEQRTRGHEENLMRNFNLEVSPRLTIFVVASLCGGTGSGTFLDMAYSLRSAYPNVQIIGYLVISPELYGNTPNMCANTYAALMELDYYSRPGTHFDACYDQRHLVIIRDQRPAFDYTYLVSKDTDQGNYSINNQQKLWNVIAHKIALEFSGEMAPAVKEIRDNFTLHMLQEDDHPRPNSQWYLTFGLAAIYFPRERISQITLTRISRKLVEFWLQGEGQSPEPSKLLDQFLMESRWHSDLDRKDGFIQKLEATTLESDKAFSAVMTAWRTKLENAIAECKTKDARSSLMRQLQRDFKDQFRKTLFGDTETTRGEWLTKLITNRRNIIDRLQGDIDKFLAALLAPSNQHFSIANARNWLDALQIELNFYQNKWGQRVKELNSAWELEQLEKKWKQIEQNIQDIEAEFNWLPLNSKNSRVQECARKALIDTAAAIKHNFDLTAALEAVEIGKHLQGCVQKQASDLTSLSRIVDDLKSYYGKNESILRESNSDEMSGEEIFDESDIERCYNELLPDNQLRAQLVEISQSILEPAGEGKSLEIFLNGNLPNPEQLREYIPQMVNRLFGSHSAGLEQSVIKRFNQKYLPANRAARLGQIIREASPLLPLNLSDRYFHNDPAKRIKLVGFKASSDREVQDFQNLLTQSLGIPDNELKQIQAEDEISIVSEYAGFPLRLINGLEQLRNYYLRERNSDNSLLHNDRRPIFTDIIPPDVGIMQKLQDIFYPCLALNLIQQNPETQQLEFQYFDESRGKYYTAFLSLAWNQAIEQLVDDSYMEAALRKLLDDNIANIESDSRWREHYLSQLQEFVEQVDNLTDDDINYPYRSRVVGTRGTAGTPAQEGVIDRFRRQMQERVKALPVAKVATLASTPADDDSIQNSSDVIAQLETLAKLRKQGILSEAQFESAKKRILGL